MDSVNGMWVLNKRDLYSDLASDGSARHSKTLRICKKPSNKSQRLDTFHSSIWMKGKVLCHPKQHRCSGSGVDGSGGGVGGSGGAVGGSGGGVGGSGGWEEKDRKRLKEKEWYSKY